VRRAVVLARGGGPLRSGNPTARRIAKRGACGAACVLRAYIAVALRVLRAYGTRSTPATEVDGAGRRAWCRAPRLRRDWRDEPLGCPRNMSPLLISTLPLSVVAAGLPRCPARVRGSRLRWRGGRGGRGLLRNFTGACSTPHAAGSPPASR